MIGRVHGRRAFERFRSEGRRVSAGHLWCVVIADPTLDRPHVAFAIGRPVGPAVVRNRIRRRLRSALQATAAGWPPGWYLFGVRPGATSSSFEELADMLQRLLNRVVDQGTERVPR